MNTPEITKLPLGRKLQVGGAVLVLALAGADIATTYQGLQQGFLEGTPFVSHLMNNFGVLGGLIGADGIVTAFTVVGSEATRYLENRFAAKRYGGFLVSNLVLGVANGVAADNVINNLHLINNIQ